jgi:hypothetical protein
VNDVKVVGEPQRLIRTANLELFPEAQFHKEGIALAGTEV